MKTIDEEPDEEEEFCVAECNIYKQRFGLEAQSACKFVYQYYQYLPQSFTVRKSHCSR